MAPLPFQKFKAAFKSKRSPNDKPSTISNPSAASLGGTAAQAPLSQPAQSDQQPADTSKVEPESTSPPTTHIASQPQRPGRQTSAAAGVAPPLLETVQPNNIPVEKYGLFFLNKEQCEETNRNGQAKCNTDVVALHGINGDAFSTWTHSNGQLWLRDFLPSEFPGARIFSFGYPSEVVFTLNTGKLDDFARSLLVKLSAVRHRPEVCEG